ncbi:hypothetical protein SAMN05428969_2377 [Devosia sp. YR412]|uniref:DUF6968 family protein n=1 Tax=Devosia sp. YR412 TaxID=1881030 RepID=UPI0008D32E56|nr:hypothetical protein [Devosia sp. YR412]SEQ24523.1 hypothetical protein SAMN05428969_2377 [Devosia sp. YR412]
MLAGTRTLTIDSKKGPIPVEVRLYLAEPYDTVWHARYEIDWPEGTVKSHSVGNDMIAALHGAIEKIVTELYMSRYHHERNLWWVKPWNGYGFPMPKGARDLLIGHDQEFFGLDK